MEEKVKLAITYVHMDKLRRELIEDGACDVRIDSLEAVMKIIRQQLTGIAE